MEGHLLMSAKERERSVVLSGVASGLVSLAEASVSLGLSRRQLTRIYERYREAKDAGLVHRSRGRPSNRRMPADFRQKVLERYKERYMGFGPTLAAEKLAEEELAVSAETLRRWLMEAGLWQRQRSRKPYRQRRQRRARFGELVQLDGSHHRWFGPEHPQCCIMQFIDDATNERLALMDGEETTEVAMRALWRWVERYGIPRAVYMDRKSVFYSDRTPTPEEQLKGQKALSQFGKVCRRLGIELIFANSPQAKGRVERAHAVLQDRLVKELALQNITGIDKANTLLCNGFIDKLNEHLRCPARDKRNGHRKVPKHLKLADVFCHEQTRKLTNDWTVRYANRHYQIQEKQDGPRPKPNDSIAVRIRLDGSVYLSFNDKPLAFSECGAPPSSAGHKPKDPGKAAPARGTKTKPAYNHPWRKQAG